MLNVAPVTSKRDWKTFVDLPWFIYANDPNWAPPLRISIHDILNVKKNPFFKHATSRAFVAYRDRKAVGRITATIDTVNNEFHSENVGVFGYFECENNGETAKALLDTASDWLKERGVQKIRGPINLSTNNECGLLVEGFSAPASVMMNYNPSYYEALIGQNGFKKEKDLYAWEVDQKNSLSDRMLAQIERLRAKSQIQIRPIRMSDFKKEVETILEIYNDAWETNWGFVPMNREEFLHTAKDLKLIVDPELALILEKNGEAIGFGLALPDLNQVLKKIPSGKLLPFGLLKLLWNLKGPGRRKTVNRARIVTLGIKKQYQTRAVGPLVYSEFFKRGPKRGYYFGEASWILEDNAPMNKALEGMGAQKTKTYRIFEKQIS